MSSLLVLYRVYRLEIQYVSHAGIVDPALLTVAPLTFSLVQRGGGGGGYGVLGLRQINTCRKVPSLVKFL